MFVLGHFINALAGVLDAVLFTYMMIVIAAALVTWVNPDPYHPIVRFLYIFTDPVFRLVRRVLPLPPMGIDFSPLVVVLIISFLRMFLVPTLEQLAAMFK